MTGPSSARFAAILSASPAQLAGLTPTQQELAHLVRDGGHTTVHALARALGLHRKTVQERLDRATRVLEMPPELADRLRAGGAADPADVHSAWLKDKDGDSVYVYFGKPEGGAEDVLERIREAMSSVPPAPAVVPPAYVDDDLLTIYPLADAHVGMVAWGKETGEAYDTDLATSRIVEWVGRCVASSPASGTALILDVGDLMHADDQTNQTPRSKHVLDVDTRYYRTLEVTIAALATSVELALRKHAQVIVRILPGNHNPHSYMAIMFALAERYRENPRVTVQKVPGEFFVHQFGQNMIAAHHGDKAKAERIVLYLADEHAAIWGKTKHRFLFTGHLHHHKSADIGGVTWEQLRAVTARDAYAVSHAYTARAQLQAITLHKDRGEVQRVKVGM
jgi:DNA-binding CsgD family transcriptional regulator